jgi:hypothetical protein
MNEYENELQTMASDLRAGREIVYDQNDLRRLFDEKEMFSNVPAKAVWGAVFRFFLPAILILLAIYLCIFLLRK